LADLAPGIANSMLAAKINRRHAGLMLFQYPNDLLFTKP
jgi:hypothetical protein